VHEAPAGPDLDQVKAELQALEDAYAKAENAKDAEAVVAYYADDAQNYPPNEPPAIGKAAILERLKRDFAADTSGNTFLFEAVDVWAAGDLAVETGKTYITDPDGNVSTAKYISVFEKRDGKYVCIRDMWSDNSKPE
jgi:ketosteroid isomerase-like protein